MFRLLLSAWLVAAAPAWAQLGLPSLPSLPPSLPGGLDRPLDRTERPLRGAQDLLRGDDLLNLRRSLIDGLLREHPRRIERDPQGEPIVRGELLLHSPSVALLEAARAAGFSLLREQRLADLDLHLVTLQAPPGVGTAAARALLRTLDEGAVQDFNHLYLPAGGGGRAVHAPPPTGGAAAAGKEARVGLVDSGVATTHPALAGARVLHHGCQGRPVPHLHGTAVASLLVGARPPFRGAAPGATLYAADIYCGQPTGGSAEAIVQALAWMAQQQVPVVNLSLVGPPNRLLEQAVKALQARGHLLVAAVGNDGPTAPPLYPAAYPGVVGVTAVDTRPRALPEAGQGPHVLLAAPGAELAAADHTSGGYTIARGTSFAAPLVAGLLAAELPRPDPARAQQAVEQLAAQAQDAGAPGRDPVYGQGVVGMGLRVEPRSVSAKR